MCQVNKLVDKPVDKAVDNLVDKAAHCAQPVWHNRASIDALALQHNVARVRALSRDRQVLAVVKADAYGHGLKSVVRALDAAVDGFAVAHLAEGLACRGYSDKRIVVLSGLLTAAQLPLCAQHRLDVCVHHPPHLEWLDSYRGRQLTVWLKVDSGMHRLGLPVDAVPATLRRLTQHPAIEQVVLMSHLANADDLADTASAQQIARFAACAAPEQTRSLANSAGVCGWPQAHYDWLRPGLMLYGVSPLKQKTAVELKLRPVMTFQARLVAIKSVAADSAVGYGGAFVTRRRTTLGWVSAGYGDGYPAAVGAAAYVTIKQQPAAIVGRVCMDMLAVDLTPVPNPQLGDEVCLWGESPSVAEVAAWAQRSAYELLSQVTARVPRVVVGGK